MEAESSNQQGYSLIEDPSGNQYYFTTVNDIQYVVYFNDSDGFSPSVSFADKCKIFGFGPIIDSRPVGKYKLPTDELAVEAIFEAVYIYLTKYPEAVLIFVCDEASVWRPDDPAFKSERLAKYRHYIFDNWFKQWELTNVMPAKKIDYKLYDRMYCSALYRADSPHGYEIETQVPFLIQDKL